MKLKKKNIAVLMTAIDSDGQAQILEGIAKYGKEHGCNIAVFVWFTWVYEKDKHNLGELNITKLPDLNLFDGVIVVANAFHVEGNKKILLEMLSKVKCPVLSLGSREENFYYVGTDTYLSMRELVEHFVVEHKCQRLHFVKGVEGNPDAEERYRAYEDVLKEHGIPIEEERITQGDFYIMGGENAANQIMNSKLPFPEVVICANDTMAIAACNVFQEKGYSIPEDIMVAGYDGTMEGQQYIPNLTTVRSSFLAQGAESCRILCDIVEGKDVPKEVLLTDELLLGGSCGCNTAQKNEPFHNENKHSLGVHRKLINHLIEVEKNIMEGDQYGDWIEALKKFVLKTEPEGFYCCVNENFIEQVFQMGVRQQEAMTTKERLAYEENIKVTLAYRDGKFFEKESFPSKLAFSDIFDEEEEPKLYIFSPIHYLERNFGYFVFVDSYFPVNNPLYVNWLINMGDAIENIRKQNLLQIAIRELNEMYIRDPLTGVYNRFGLEKFFKQLKEHCISNNKKMLIGFADVDHLKYINDHYGHERGDQTIKMAAGVLSMSAKDYGIVRFGGDEFIVLGAMEDEAEAVVYWSRVQDAIKNYNNIMSSADEKSGLSLSYGYELFKVTEELSLTESIQVADKKMYQDKSRKKKVR